MDSSAQTDAAAPAPWSSRWYSAAKRFGLAVLAAALLSFLRSEATAAIVSGVSETDAILRIMSLSALAEGVLLCLPVLAAAWGFVRPREYPGTVRPGDHAEARCHG